MGIQLDSVEEVKELVQELELKIGSVEDLNELLRVVNASYDPDEHRISTIRSIMTKVPMFGFGIAGAIAFFLLTGASDIRMSADDLIAILGILFGTAGVATIVSTFFGFISLRQSQNRLALTSNGHPRSPANDQPSIVEQQVRDTNITLPKERL